MTAPKITVVGIGEDGLDGLAPATRKLVEGADVLVGGARHLSKVSGGKKQRIDWKDGFDAAFDEMAKKTGKQVVVLASGDPLNFGVGKNVIARFGVDAVTVLPAPGAFSLAAARMGWPLADVECLTVHGRDLETINLYLVPGQKIFILSWDGETPGKVAGLLTSRGFGPSKIVVLSNMGGDETRVEATAHAWGQGACPDLNVIAINCAASPDADQAAWSRVPGLSEDAYEHDGQITKRHVRAATLARLAPMPGQVLWDVGAGSGAIGIEWLRAQPSSSAIAIERDKGRCKVIARNAGNLGVPGLTIIEGAAPDVFDGLTPQPDAVFLGGGVFVEGLLEACWKALSPGGRLVANAVTVESQKRLLSYRNEIGGDLTRLSVAHAGPVGGLQAFTSLKDIIQLAAVKK
ncbi:MAG: precorrin-6y C5,15-methyltransferase (decarboxylating) subunit CbiE [Proteobacteria bacterium]|nr:precorrin-6y C5,15-methyltransferase (decarboxylating) subunit CbiE [Pseudomonadota bacterium]MDA1022041.1 precorrin-6y C5,15-methyltransferase (decarboxylating) subunit CbiE [Pseudomonadota bacterium]